MRGQSSVVRRAVAHFVLLAFAALLVLTVSIDVMSRHIANHEAIRDAEVRSRGIARGIAAPLIDAGVRAGLAPNLERLGSALQNRMRDGSVAHIIIWGERGRILWSDQPSLVGDSLDLPATAAALLGSDNSLTRAPGDHEPHPSNAPTEASLFEVYVGAHDAEGVPFVFEAYISQAWIDDEAGAVFNDLLPLALGSLLIFQIAVLPLAYSLARKVERAYHQRSALLARTLAAWHSERRRLAQDLHDTVIQDLSAASYAFPSVAAQLPTDASADIARETARRIGSILEHNLTALRTLLIELLPSELSGTGLVPAIERLGLRAQERGVEVTVDVAADVDLQEAVAGLVYRVVREGLANVCQHAEARRASVQVRTEDGRVEVVVSDDGRGPAAAEPASGHFGLRLLRDLIVDVGGESELVERPEGGTCLRVWLPIALPE